MKEEISIYKVDIIIWVSQKELTADSLIEVDVIRGEKIDDKFVFHESQKEKLITTVARIWKVEHFNASKWHTQVAEFDEAGMPCSFYIGTTIYLDKMGYDILQMN